MPLTKLGWQYFKDGNSEDALALLKAQTQFTTEKFEPFYYLAIVQKAAKEKEAALKNFRLALKYLFDQDGIRQYIESEIAQLEAN